MLNYKKVTKRYAIFSIVIAIVLCATGVVASTASFNITIDLPITSSNESEYDVNTDEHNSNKKVIQTEKNKGETLQKELDERSAIKNIVWPVPNSNQIIEDYGVKTDSATNVQWLHKGIDIKADLDDLIIAAKDGVVIFAGWNDSYGKTVILEHQEGLRTLYAHCNVLLVNEGDNIKAGQEIAKIGNTGYATQPHLHFEVIKDGKAVNPLSYIKP